MIEKLNSLPSLVKIAGESDAQFEQRKQGHDLLAYTKVIMKEPLDCLQRFHQFEYSAEKDFENRKFEGT